MQSGYLLDTLDIATTYGVYVQKVSGALDFLKRKGETAHNWLDSHGEEAYTDAGDIYFEPRDIILFCYIKADTKDDFLAKLNLFKAILEGFGLHTLKLPFLTYTLDVYFKDGGTLNMLTGWNSSKLVGKFILKLREPIPSLAPHYLYVGGGMLTYSGEAISTVGFAYSGSGTLTYSGEAECSYTI